MKRLKDEKIQSFLLYKNIHITKFRRNLLLIHVDNLLLMGSSQHQWLRTTCTVSDTVSCFILLTMQVSVWHFGRVVKAQPC